MYRLLISYATRKAVYHTIHRMNFIPITEPSRSSRRISHPAVASRRVRSELDQKSKSRTNSKTDSVCKKRQIATVSKRTIHSICHTDTLLYNFQNSLRVQRFTKRASFTMSTPPYSIQLDSFGALRTVQQIANYFTLDYLNYFGIKKIVYLIINFIILIIFKLFNFFRTLSLNRSDQHLKNSDKEIRFFFGRVALRDKTKKKKAKDKILLCKTQKLTQFIRTRGQVLEVYKWPLGRSLIPTRSH